MRFHTTGFRPTRLGWAGLILLGLGLLLAGCDNKDINSLPEAKGLPGTPALTASALGTTITLNWPSIPGATDYTLYWSNTAGVTTGTGAPIAAVTPPYAHTGLLQGTPYHYVVTATVSGLETPASNEAFAVTIPPPPTGLTAAGASRQLTLNWPATPGATRYDLYWLPTPGVTPASGNLIANVTSGVVHPGLYNASTYFYVLTASNAAGTSAPSASVLGLTPAPNVAVYVDATYVDPFVGEGADAVQQTVAFFGYPWFPFIGRTATEFSPVLASSDVVVIPELFGYLGTDMGPDVGVIRNFVNNGGTLVSVYPDPIGLNLLNLTFGFGIVPSGTGSPIFDRTPVGDGTLFGTLPATTLSNNIDTLETIAGLLPPGSLPIYRDSGTSYAVVVLIPYGAGHIVILGWNWLQPTTAGGFQDGGWIDVMRLSLLY